MILAFALSDLGMVYGFVRVFRKSARRVRRRRHGNPRRR